MQFFKWRDGVEVLTDTTRQSLLNWIDRLPMIAVSAGRGPCFVHATMLMAKPCWCDHTSPHQCVQPLTPQPGGTADSFDALQAALAMDAEALYFVRLIFLSSNRLFCDSG